jgi:hypothetical protein
LQMTKRLNVETADYVLFDRNSEFLMSFAFGA